jgi:magnesium-transporting ATPase (P-type)
MPPPGDKVETAISIAHSCRLFTADMPEVQLRESHFKGKAGHEAHRQVCVCVCVCARAGAPRVCC